MRRTFRPNYLSFAGTYQCDLACPHCCVPIEWTDRLDIAAALRFLDDAFQYGIGVLGFHGRRAVPLSRVPDRDQSPGGRLGFRFDKIVTNGVWYRDRRQCGAF